MLRRPWPTMKPFPILLLALVSLVAAVNSEETTVLNLGQEENVTTAPSESSVSTEEDLKGMSTAQSNASLPSEEDRTTTVASTIKLRTTEGISTSSTSSTVRFFNTKRRSSFVDQDKGTDITYHKNDEDIFVYDYGSLRKWGLIAAAILFILGILILTCGKHGKLLRCRRKKRARNYDVTPA